jgi:hypothetical protein
MEIPKTGEEDDGVIPNNGNSERLANLVIQLKECRT